MTNGIDELMKEEAWKVAGLQKINTIKSQIITEPQHQISKLRQLRILLCDKNYISVFKLRKSILQTMCGIYIQILPSYRIRKQTELEKSQKQKADTRKLRMEEEMLLTSFEKYVDLLMNIITGHRPSREAKEIIDYSWQHKDVVCAVKCATELYLNNPSFNLSDKLLQIIVPALNFKEQELSDFVLLKLASVFDADKTGEDTLQICKAVAELARAWDYDVENNVLILFLKLNIVEADEETLDKETLDGQVKILNLKSSERKKMLSRKERKDDKATIKYRKALRELNATNSLKRKSKMNAFILRVVISLYVSILKRSEDCGRAPYLPYLLEGIARYTKLVNMDFIAGLVHYLYTIASAESTYLVYKTHCIVTAMFIMLQSKRALTLHDPSHVYRLVFGWLLDDQNPSWSDPVILYHYSSTTFEECATFTQQLKQTVSSLDSICNNTMGSVKNKKIVDLWTKSQEISLENTSTIEFPHQLLNVHLLLACLEGMLIHRRRYIPSNRALAYTKRLASLALHQPTKSLEAILAFIKRIFSFYPQCEVLFDSDAEIGGVYDAEQTDPDLCKAASATLWELHDLQCYHPSLKIRLLAQACVQWSEEENEAKPYIRTFRPGDAEKAHALTGKSFDRKRKSFPPKRNIKRSR